MAEMTRRRAVQLPLAAMGRRREYYSPTEAALLGELAELIIPADAHSPGARQAGVAAYLAANVHRTLFKKGLAYFSKLEPGERPAAMARIARAEADPKLEQEKFFVAFKRAAAKAYYTSKTGIHQELEYKGNTVQTGDYAGFLPE